MCGIVAVVSFEGLRLWDQLRLSSVLKVTEQIHLVHYLQNCIGLRLKAVHFFDEPALIGRRLVLLILFDLKGWLGYLWFIIRPLLKEEMSGRFHFHGGMREEAAAILPDYDGRGFESYSEFDWVESRIAAEQR